MRLPSAPSSLPIARAEAERRAREAGMDETNAAMLAAAVHEAVTNAIEHGNRGDSALYVTLEFESDPDQLTVRILDQGLGLTSGVEDEPPLTERGRGLRLMRALVDEVRITQGRGEVVLVKAIRAHGGQ